MKSPRHQREENLEDSLLIGLIQREVAIDIREKTNSMFEAIRGIIRSEFGEQWHVLPALTLQIRLSRALKEQIIQLVEKGRK